VIAGSTITDLEAGDYTVTISDGYGCTLISDYTVNEPDVLVQNSSFENTTCGEDNGIIYMSAYGGVPPYQFNIGNGYSDETDYYDLAPGTYYTSTKDANDCETYETITIEESEAPQAEAGDDKELTCSNNTVQLDGTESSTSSTFTYLWTTEDGHIVSGENTLTPIVDAPGTYTLTVSDYGADCSDVDETHVTQNGEAPSVSMQNQRIL